MKVSVRINMRKLLKKYFIPHEENGYKPHFFREVSFSIILSIVVVLFASAIGSQLVIRNTDMMAHVLPKVLVDYANNDRQLENLKTLAINPVLEKAAQLKAQDMAKKEYFAHKTPEGYSPWYWLDKVDYDFSYAGENLAVNFSDSVDVNLAWMASPKHRENIMNGNFTEIGIATAEGMYKGRKTTFVVQFFGRPTQNENVVAIKNNIPTIRPTVSTSSPKIISTIASSSVLGASGENELYVAVENKVAGEAASTSPIKYSNWIEKLILSPNKILSTVYLIIAVIIIIGLLLMIFIEVRKQHPLYILLWIVILLLMLALLYIYQSVLFGPLLIA